MPWHNDRESYRLPGWDYSEPGIYFVTICTKYRMHDFGHVRNGKMILSKMGMIVNDHWRKIPQHFPNVRLDTHIIMPDHIHGILNIARDAMSRTKNTRDNFMSCISPKPGSLPTIIRSYKSTCANTIRKQCDIHFEWQQRYYDRIIFDADALANAREYIMNNPQRWTRQ